MSVLPVTAQQLEDLLTTSECVLVAFTAAWCPPCRLMSSVIDNFSQDRDLARITFVKVDADAENGLLTRFNVTSLPTFLLLKTDATSGCRELARYVGGQEPVAFKHRLQSAIASI